MVVIICTKCGARTPAPAKVHEADDCRAYGQFLLRELANNRNKAMSRWVTGIFQNVCLRWVMKVAP